MAHDVDNPMTFGTVIVADDALETTVPYPLGRATRESGFVRLTALSLRHVQSSTAYEYLCRQTHPNVTELILTVTVASSNAASPKFGYCLQLFQAVFRSSSGYYGVHMINPAGNLTQTKPRVVFAALEPVLTRLPLRFLQVAHFVPLDLSQEDVTKIAQVLNPTIASLFLNSMPYGKHIKVEDMEPPSLTLHAVAPFATECPKLRSLGLYCNTPHLDASCAPVTDLSQTGRQFYFGNSPIEDPPRVAKLLSSPGFLTITQQDRNDDVQQQKSWTIVGDVLAMLGMRRLEIQRVYREIETIKLASEQS